MLEEVSSVQLVLDRVRKEGEEQKQNNENQISSLNKLLEEKSQVLKAVKEKLVLTQSQHETMKSDPEKNLSEIKESECAKTVAMMSELAGKSDEVLSLKHELDQIQEEKMSLLKNIQEKYVYSSLKNEADKEMLTLKRDMEQEIKDKDELLTRL